MSVQLGLLLAASATAGLAVAWLTGPVRDALIHWGVYDAPNARSLHAEKKPRGGGLAILAVVLPGWLAADWILGLAMPVPAAVLVCIGLAAVSVVGKYLVLIGRSRVQDLCFTPQTSRRFRTRS